MKILLVSGIHPPDIGGPATFIPGFAKFLKEQGNEVVLLTLSSKPRESREIYPQVKFISRNLKFIIRQLVTIFSLMQEAKKTDIIFSNGLFEECSLVGFALRKKVIFKIVGDPVWERFRNETGSKITIEDFNGSKSPLKYCIQRYVLRKSLNQSSAICTPSPQLCEFIRAWGVESPVEIIPNGVPIVNIPCDAGAKFDVATVSRLVKWKNIDLIIDSCREQNLRLAIIGDGPERENLEAQTLDCNDRIVFLGELYGEDLDLAISSAKVFTLFSEYEGLSFALISAMMLGRYIVASDIPGNRNAIASGVNGVLIPLHMVEKFGASLQEGTKDTEIVQLIRRNARASAVRDFSDHKCYERTLALMKE